MIINYPSYDSDGVAPIVKIFPQNIFAWYDVDLKKWIAPVSHDILCDKDNVKSWRYEGARDATTKMLTKTFNETLISERQQVEVEKPQFLLTEDKGIFISLGILNEALGKNFIKNICPQFDAFDNLVSFKEGGLP